MRLLRFSINFRDCWIGYFCRTYRRKRWPDSDPQDLMKIATDIWFCPVPFCKFHFRIEHCRPAPHEVEAMDLEKEVI